MNYSITNLRLIDMHKYLLGVRNAKLAVLKYIFSNIALKSAALTGFFLDIKCLLKNEKKNKWCFYFIIFKLILSMASKYQQMKSPIKIFKSYHLRSKKCILDEAQQTILWIELKNCRVLYALFGFAWMKTSILSSLLYWQNLQT